MSETAVQASCDTLEALRLELNPKQCAFVDGYLDGMPAYKAYLSAYPDSSEHVARASSTRLLKANENVMAYVAEARLVSHRANALTREEKRSYLADVVRTPVTEIVAKDGSIVEGKGHLVQEIVTSYNKDGEPSVKVKVPNKLDAIRIDNSMSGDDAPVEHVHSFAGILSGVTSSVGLPPLPSA